MDVRRQATGRGCAREPHLDCSERIRPQSGVLRQAMTTVPFGLRKGGDRIVMSHVAAYGAARNAARRTGGA